jgi:acetyl esterase/lipase
MRRILPVALFLALPLLPAWAPAGEAPAPKAPAVKTGGNFEVEVVKDVCYHEGDGADERHRLDLYLPKGHKGYPVVFFVHGGMWRSGDKKLYGPVGQVFARNGVGFVAINYRLSPKHKHPAHIEDVARAFAWTHKHIGKHGGRSDQLFACGHSAGGHLVGLLGLDPRHLKEYKLDCAAVKGLIPLSGVYEISPNLIFEPYFGKDPEVCKAASPLTHVSGKHPPALILYAEKDFPLLDVMAEQFCKKLKGCDCDSAVMKLMNRTHISIVVGLSDEADPATQAVLEFVSRHSDLKLRPREKKE